MQITFLTRKSALIYRRGLRQRVASLTLNCNGDFAIRAYGACFGADSAPTLFVRNTRRPCAVFEKESFHTMSIAHVSLGADCRADYCPRGQKLLSEAFFVRLPARKTRGNSHFRGRLAILFVY